MDPLVIPESDIRRHGPGHVLAVCWRQWRTERALAQRGVHFRDTDAERVAAAYAAMTDVEFDAINGRQDWANWRTIPRALSGHVPRRPLRVLDLGCGTGSSTRVLAFYCPIGSRITGYEFAESLVEIARRRRYVHRSGGAADVHFTCRNITEPFHEPDGILVGGGGVDVINASGVVGHHLTVKTAAPLVDEILRVLRAGGVAMLDVGPRLPARDLRRLLEAAGLCLLGRYRSWCLDPTGQMVFRKP